MPTPGGFGVAFNSVPIEASRGDNIIDTVCCIIFLTDSTD